MIPNNSHCPSSSSSSSSNPSTPGIKSSPPSPSTHHNHSHNPTHHSSHHGGHHSSPNYRHNNSSVVTTAATILQPNTLTLRNNRQTQQPLRPYFAEENDLDQQILVQANSANTTNSSKGLMDTNSTVVVKRRTKTDRLLYDMVSVSAASKITVDDLGNDSEASFPPFPVISNGLASAPSAGSNINQHNGQTANTNNNRTIEMSSRYFLETECCNGPNRDNLHLNGCNDAGSSPLLNETDEHSFPNQMNAYNSGHDSEEELEKCRDISEYVVE